MLTLDSMLGVFKLNKNASSDSAQTSGRFIMRANQTFRILLNAPVLKGMTVGDGQGNEPQKKSFQFAGIENGKVVPYLLKVGLFSYLTFQSIPTNNIPAILSRREQEALSRGSKTAGADRRDAIAYGTIVFVPRRLSCKTTGCVSLLLSQLLKALH